MRRKHISCQVYGLTAHQKYQVASVNVLPSDMASGTTTIIQRQFHSIFNSDLAIGERRTVADLALEEPQAHIK